MSARRAAAVLAVHRAPTATPPGVDPESFRLAMLEDVYEMLAGLDLVEAVLALSPAPQPAAEAVTWPGTPVVALDSAAAEGAATVVSALLSELADRGYTEAVIVAADAPDLPGLLIGKLWRALGRAEVALCPSADGALVALAAHLPPPTWLAGAADLDAVDAADRLRAAAPQRRALAIGPGWHRLRSPLDLGRLDRDLEGWESTRAVLSGRA